MGHEAPDDLRITPHRDRAARGTMARHSKHNTASGHFTYAEYQYVRAC